MNLNGRIELENGFTFDYTNMFGEKRIEKSDVENLLDKVARAHNGLKSIRSDGFAKGHLSKDGKPEAVYFTRLPFIKAGNPNTLESITNLEKYGEKVRANFDAVIFLGVGGSYLGNKVLFDVKAGEFWNEEIEKGVRKGAMVYFGGNNADVDQDKGLLKNILMHSTRKEDGTKFKVMLVPISKSGSTLETITAFLYFYDRLSEAKADLDLSVTVVTDLQIPIAKSPLHSLALKHGWDRFDVKNGVGGRFSVLSEPGLITAAVIGLDIRALLNGARDMELACLSEKIEENPALLNATLKYISGESYGADIEVLMPYSMKLKSFSDWYVQLLAESLGKRTDRDKKTVNYGRTPISAVGTTDMHAQTQMHQDGKRNKVVQFIKIKNPATSIKLKNPFPEIEDFAKYDNLNLDSALNIALDSNKEALTSDNRFNAEYIIPKLNEYTLGQMFYFLMLTVAYEAELANVDAFDQPGVEAYKKIMKQKMSNL